jgi:hypothetical protein
MSFALPVSTDNDTLTNNAASLGSCFATDSNFFSLRHLPAPSSPPEHLEKVTNRFVL